MPFLTNCYFSNVGVHVTFYIERFIPKLVPSKDTLRVRHRDTPSSDPPVVTDLGEGETRFREGKVLPLESFGKRRGIIKSIKREDGTEWGRES
jgi:hypothetical protein